MLNVSEMLELKVLANLFKYVILPFSLSLKLHVIFVHSQCIIITFRGDFGYNLALPGQDQHNHFTCMYLTSHGWSSGSNYG